ncbi:ankyrin repeat domain-containing protein [Scleromatobacter humisilvae]|uniref:Ankyrin repeat domain-containing protein n=1 Tax=Scleromatobacter humisilvae TaxID=2897159 RepID=A0A9X1YKZ0_9BURK|nr:ankyrin repeat domain-containing protein [Scleromatobacter humisilvae]MCK9688088.1 ankyrin repeat domain-containing protein [Scleromatobacter humisilvae]
MSADIPDRPDMDDDLDAAYARAHALANDGRGPSASVRANVLAAAREVAAQARTRTAIDEVALTPVAPPVAAVARGRAMAVNLSSWRIRSGAAVCAALLVVLGVWRFDANRHVDGGVQVATAALELAAPPTSTPPRELPVPALAAASVPYMPPPVVEDPVDATRVAQAASAKPAARERDRDLVVAQAAPSYRSSREAPAPEARADARRTPAPAAVSPPRDVAPNAAPAAPVATAPEAPPTKAPSTVTITAAAAPPPLATMPPMPPSVVPRRVPVGSLAKAAPVDEARVAAADAGAQRAEIVGSTMKRVMAPSASTLHAAADRGDVDALKALLAEPAARVDAPDASGRTALLHAVLAQQVGAVRILVAAGADPAHADSAGLTPRAAAQAGGNGEIAALLAPSR